MEIHLKPQPAETSIVGHWVFENGKMSADDNCRRIEWLKTNYLKKISINDGGWTTTYQNTDDGKYWQMNYPQGELQGGGAPMLTRVD